MSSALHVPYIMQENNLAEYQFNSTARFNYSVHNLKLF